MAQAVQIVGESKSLNDAKRPGAVMSTRDTALLADLNAGLNYPQAADKYDISVARVRQIAEANGFSRSQWLKIQRRPQLTAAVQLRAQGLSPKTIAQQLRVAPWRVRDLLSEAEQELDGLRRHRDRLLEDNRILREKLARTGATPRLYRTRPAAVQYLQERYNIKMGVNSLSQLAYKGRGPRYSKIGGAVLYGEPDLDAWVEEQSSKPPLSRRPSKSEVSRG